MAIASVHVTRSWKVISLIKGDVEPNEWRVFHYDMEQEGEPWDRSVLMNHEWVDCFERCYSDAYQCNYHVYVYKPTQEVHEEQGYLNLMSTILESSKNIRSDRTHVGTYSIFGPQLEFDLTESIPILTTKHLAWKVVLKELLWFLKGDTNSKHLEEQGVMIWNGNSTREFLDKRGLMDYPEGDVGPMYGFQWRHWGSTYQTCASDYSNQGYDQLEALVKQIQTDPYSRRHLLTTYNPSDVSKSVLAPCHGLTTMFYVEGDTLSCKVFCRSSDVFLGLPFNIASYAMLTTILAKKCRLIPKRLIVTMGDAHIYSNHLEQVQKQLTRSPYPFPKFWVSDKVKQKSWEQLSMDDFDVIGYIHHPGIKAPMAI